MHSKYTPARLDVLDGEYDKIIFFEHVLNNKKLIECAKCYFWINLIKNFYCLERDIPDYKYYEDKIIKRYEGVIEILDDIKRLEGDKKEYSEDFGKFIDLNIPLEYIYRKREDLSSNINIELIKQDVYIMKIGYEISKGDAKIGLTRLFFEKSIANWKEKKV